ncbi:hypothetical protein C1H46_001601 [Malus baccata]|uniref:Uncharacterized protein n=1 Tax=Malus baccata TaxID=106549 RepID=A0A540NNW1_MALBA|nr:hypothetical protein C1H46_001601 [Malus baccata]
MPVSANIPFHASGGGSGDRNTKGLQMMGISNEGEWEQMGGRKVGSRRGGIGTKVVTMGNSEGATSQNPMVRIENKRQQNQQEQVMSQHLVVVQQPSNLSLGQTEGARVHARRGARKGNAALTSGLNNELMKDASALLEDNLLEVSV